MKRVVTRSNGRRMTILARILQAPPNGDGYPHITLHRPGKAVSAKVHILVARAFHGKCPKGLEVRHLDGKKANSRSDNLRYGTPIENGSDKVDHGGSTRGEKNPKAVLTRAKVRMIRKAIGTNIEIADAHGVSPSTVSSIKHRHSWGWL
jgi:hypothetical protein